MVSKSLQSTAWLAKRLGLSVSTIERLRASGEGELPPHITIGRHTIRYDEAVVEAWLSGRLQRGELRPVTVPSPVESPPRKRRLGKQFITLPPKGDSQSTLPGEPHASC